MPIAVVARAALVVMAMLVSLSSREGLAHINLLEPKTPADIGLAKGARVLVETLETLANPGLWTNVQLQDPAMAEGKVLAFKKYLLDLSEKIGKIGKTTELDFSAPNRQFLSNIAQKLMIVSRYNNFRTPAELSKQMMVLTAEIRARLVPEKMPELKGSSSFLKSKSSKLAEEEVRLKQHDGAFGGMASAVTTAVMGLKLNLPPRYNGLEVPEVEFQTFTQGSSAEKLDSTRIDAFWEGVEEFLTDYVDYQISSRRSGEQSLLYSGFLIEQARHTFSMETSKYVKHLETTKAQQQLIKDGSVDGIDLLVVAENESPASRLRALASPVGLCDLILKAKRVEQTIRLPQQATSPY